MTEAQIASLDGVASSDQDPQLEFSALNMARRSISVFSRRGTETPEPKPPFIAQAGLSRQPTKIMNDRQKSWIKRGGLDRRNTQSIKKPKGTILNAVPPAETIRMTKLEEEMATSPNEEIMSAISDHPRTQFPSATGSVRSAGHEHSPTLLTPRTPSRVRRDTNTRIGVWVSGVAHWDEETVTHTPSPGEQDIREETGFAPFSPEQYSERQRPNLSVTIPSAHTAILDMSLSTIVQPRPSRHILSVAPASIISRFGAAPPPQIVVEEFPARDLLPLDSSSVQATTPSEPATPSIVAHNSGLGRSNSLNPKQKRTSSSTTSSLDHDDASVYSKRSSATSVDAIGLAAALEAKAAPSTSSQSDSFEIANPADAGVFEETVPMSSISNINKPLPRVPAPRNMRLAPAPPASPTNAARPHSSRSTKSAPDGRKADRSKLRPIIPAALRSSSSLTKLDLLDAEFTRASPYAHAAPDISSELESPTLSQAENDLHLHLSTIDDDDESRDEALLLNNATYGSDDNETSCSSVATGLAKSTSIHRNDSVRSVMQPPSRAPTVPKRSRKRDWRKSAHANHIASQILPLPPKAPGRRRSDSAMKATVLPGDHIVASTSIPDIRRSLSANTSRKALAIAQYMQAAAEDLVTPEAPSFTYDDGLCVVEGPIVMRLIEQSDLIEENPAASAASAENVLLRILASLNSLDDLANTATINKGMYRVFKENELHLVQTVARNQSPAGWELREWCPPVRNGEAENSSKASSQFEHTPLSYMRCHKRDLEVINGLKKSVSDHCQTFIRRETAFSLATPFHPNAQRFTDVFWRIWTFCTVFGSQKGREEDVTGQLDWLKGGLLANNSGFSATVNTNLEYDMGSVLLNAPEHFAMGNKDGLGAMQLYDMTEIWMCLVALLSGYQGRVDQARRFGIFADCGIEEGDMEHEEHMLEEWIAYVLTLGPGVILEMAAHASDPSPAGFAIARENGWTKWTPALSTRTTFLKEPVARLYEERVANASMLLQNPREVERKEMSRKRVASLAAEIKLRRQTSGYKRLPLIDMNTERAMSMTSRRSSVTTSRSASMIQTSNLPPHSRPPIGPPYASYSAGANVPYNFSTAAPSPISAQTATARRPLSPSQWSPRRISPIIEDRVETFNKMALANLDGRADSTVERAVQKITDMGFTEGQAKDALRMTDMGDGLRVDRAVDLLLRAR